MLLLSGIGFYLAYARHDDLTLPGPRKYCGPLPLHDTIKALIEVKECHLVHCILLSNYPPTLDFSKFQSEYRQGDEIYYYSDYRPGFLGRGGEGFVLRRAGKEIDALRPTESCIQ
jgi:hypothetical protein